MPRIHERQFAIIFLFRGNQGVSYGRFPSDSELLREIPHQFFGQNHAQSAPAIAGISRINRPFRRQRFRQIGFARKIQSGMTSDAVPDCARKIGRGGGNVAVGNKPAVRRSESVRIGMIIDRNYVMRFVQNNGAKGVGRPRIAD